LTVVVTGGFVTTAFGVRLSAHSPVPSFTLAATCIIVWTITVVRRDALKSELDALSRAWTSRSPLAIAFVALTGVVIAGCFHTFSATGADASGYLSYTRLLLGGDLTRSEPLTAVAKWADGPATVAPLGWHAAAAASGHSPAEQVPTYAIGLPLLLAPFAAVAGDIGAALAIPLMFGIAILATGGLAARLGDALAAVIAATWLASSPVALLHAMQVMSDIPVTAAWLVCWWYVWTNRGLSAGIAAAVAILIRPNLAPLAAIPALALLWGTTRPTSLPLQRRATGPAGRFAFPVAVACLAVGLLQWRYFGSPVRSGYGTAADIFTVGNVAANGRLYLTWLLETQGALLLVAPLALALRRRELTWMLPFAALVVVAYLVYAVFESWTYLRFMLPAMAIAMIGASVVVAATLRQLPLALRALAVPFVVLALATANLTSAREHGVFRFADRQWRGREIGEALAASVPVNAVLLSAEQSGTMRYYTGRSILRWDLLTRDAMPDALDWLRLNGYQLWVVLDDWEEEPFRWKFPELAAVSLDDRPTFESAPGVGIRTRVWRVAGGVR
jgi:hypothetical protein